MLLPLLRSTEWAQFADLVSPSFFRVLSVGDLTRQTRALLTNYRDRAGFASARAFRHDALVRAHLPITLDDQTTREPGLPLDRASQSAAVLELYFHQLLAGGPVLLDVRPRSFSTSPLPLRWQPKPVWLVLDETFRTALARIYTGFYTDDDATFAAGLTSLGLHDVRDLFLRQFGDGQQRAVSFHLRDFNAIFHDIFVRCRELGIALHPNFLPLGFYLASLYEHLETLAVPCDVRSAFVAAQRGCAPLTP